MVASANEILQIAEKTISLKKIFLNFKNSSSSESLLIPIQNEN